MSRPAPPSIGAVAVLLAVLLGALAVAAAAPAVAVGDGGAVPAPTGTVPGGTVRYRPPVDAPVSDPFRAPPGPYGPGNRGLEYATIPNSSARAVGPGVVAFAGPVAGRLVVSVEHPDGLRSALTGLAAVRVTVGEVVRTGDPLGLTGSVLHVGVRRGRTYLDPARLFHPTRAVLVPVPALGVAGRE